MSSSWDGPFHAQAAQPRWYVCLRSFVRLGSPLLTLFGTRLGCEPARITTAIGTASPMSLYPPLPLFLHIHIHIVYHTRFLRIVLLTISLRSSRINTFIYHRYLAVYDLALRCCCCLACPFATSLLPHISAISLCSTVQASAFHQLSRNVLYRY